jgi:hypothetical protein
MVDAARAIPVLVETLGLRVAVVAVRIASG